MNRFSTRLAAGFVGLVAVAGLTGCGTGQLSQTADQAPAVNGTQGTTGNLALRDIRIQATQTGDYLEAGRNVALVFVVTNQSQQQEDELTGITSNVGEVTVTGDKTVPIAGMLMVGKPVGQPENAVADIQQVRADAVNTATAKVTLNEPISNGISYRFTFTFERAGDIEVNVPVSSATAWPTVLSDTA